MTPWFKFIAPKNSGEAHEIQIYEQIGKDWWSDEGIDAKSFADELKTIPKTQPIALRINSPGGNVWDGLTIYNLLKERSQYVTCYIDGIAASIASVIALAAHKVVMPRNAMMMIHDPSACCCGTEKDMLATAKMLATHKDSLVSVYVSETGQADADIRSKMEEETWFTGEDAFNFGLCTDLVADVQVAASFDFSKFRRVPESLRDRPTVSNSNDHMKRTTLLLDPQANTTAGGGSTPKVDDSGKPTSQPTTPVAPAAPAAGAPSNADAEIEKIKAQLKKEHRRTVERAIDNLVADGRVTVEQRGYWIEKAVDDEAVIENLSKLPPSNALPAPIAIDLTVKTESVQDIAKEMTRLRAPQDSYRRGNPMTAMQLTASAQAASDFHWRNREAMTRVLNANTISSDLKRNVILQDIVRAFALKILPLRAFSTVFNAQRLEGTDVVSVPYFALHGIASTDFDAANGYVMGDSTQSAKTVTINKRKYQPIRFDSSEMARQPALNLMQIAVMKAEKLAVDVFADVLALVTAANYGAAEHTGTAANFDATDVVGDLTDAADTAEWPTTGRSLIIKSAYKNNLLKANVITASQLSWQNYGSVAPIQDGVVARLAGFDIYTCESIPANAENLVGLICVPSGILCATSPINPAEEVRQQLSRYELVVHPTLGIGFEYRCWGNPDFDQRREVIECNYGRAVGEVAALERIVSA